METDAGQGVGEERGNATTESVQSNTIAVKEHAAALGFDACGVAAAGAIDPEDRLGAWLARGFHADMDWMARNADVRRDIQRKLPGTRSVVVVARDYYGPRRPTPPGFGRVARYAWGRDYHRVLAKPLRALAGFIEGRVPGSRCYRSLDTGPVLERAWAERAGIGWIGKNGLVLRRDFGSWFFLGVVLTTATLSPDAPVADRCGTCRACIDACPTGAIVAPRVVDARKCIAYHTVENRGVIPARLCERFDNWVFGCDVCQEVCPWNRFARETTEADFRPRPNQAVLRLDEVCAMDEPTFRTRFEGTPIRRTTLEGLRRNARIVENNAKDR